jgi:hypothetical protein
MDLVNGYIGKLAEVKLEVDKKATKVYQIKD